MLLGTSSLDVSYLPSPHQKVRSLQGSQARAGARARSSALRPQPETHSPPRRSGVRTASGPESPYAGNVGIEKLRALVTAVFQRQGLAAEIEDGTQTIPVADLDPESAREMISEEGYWGVEKTSDRILSFVVDAAGGDPQKLEQIRQAVEDGFAMAREAFDSALPSICERTHDALIEKLEAWAEAGGGETDRACQWVA